MSSPSLILIAIFLLYFLCSPRTLLHLHASPLSTVAVSFASNQTIVCALVITPDNYHRDDEGDGRYSLNCTSIPNRRTQNYPAGKAYYAAVAAGDGFLCGLFKNPSSNISVMRWWEFPDGTANETKTTVKRLYKGWPIVKLEAGEKHVCGLIGEERRMSCWRWPSFKPPTLTGLVDIAVGKNFVCALSSSGNITCHSDCDVHDVVANVPTGNFTIVAAGDSHACALSTAGKLYCWGSGAPAIDGNSTYTSLALGRNRTCAIREGGTVVCWGDGFSLPETVRGVKFLLISAKKGVFCGVRRDNFALYCWGNDEFDLNNSTVLFKQVLPGPCVAARSCSNVMPGSANLCQGETRICELQAPTSPPTQPQPPSEPTGGGWGGKPGNRLVYMVVGSVALGLTLSMLFAFLFFRYCKKKCQCHRVHDSGPLEEAPPPPPAATPPLPASVKNRSHPTMERRLSELIVQGHSSTIEHYPFQMLIDATDGFSEEKKIGSGGYGSVYRAELNGREVAIKRAEFLPTCGNRRSSEQEDAFLAELVFLSRVNHRNLVRLLGFYQDDMELVLVYDYMVNGTLYDHLHKLPSSPISSWKRRITLALDAARGIEYLHRYAVPAIIHRDIKSSNILLDETWTAKVSDFGLSLTGPDEDASHISLRVAGTVGYMDPEYYRTQCLTTKSDVYSFGVVLLELLTGCKAIHRESGDEGGSFDGDPRNVVDFAVPQINNDEVQNVLDPKLCPPRSSEIEAVQQLGYLAADCVRLEGKDRPDMTDVVYGLEVALDACAGSPLVRSMTTHSV